MTTLYDEILEQPAVLQRLYKNEFGKIDKVAAAIKRYAPRFILIAARGSSDNAARYGQYVFGSVNRLPVGLATPSLFTLYQSPPILENSLVLAISQSGQSPDICSVVEEGRRQGALTIALTNDTHSPLALKANESIDLNAGPELSIAATKTYTSSLLALAMLSSSLAGQSMEKESFAVIPDRVFQLLRSSEEIISSAEVYCDTSGCVTIGRGYNYATAFEIALKLKELTYILAEPYSSADFQHGPVAMIQGGFLVLGIVPDGKTTTELTSLLQAMRDRGARLIVIASREDTLSLADTPIPLPGKTPEWLSPIISVIPGQLFALGLAKARGIDPDQPRGLKKITRTT